MKTKCDGCGQHGNPVGRLFVECCSGGSGCSCAGGMIDLGVCRVCIGTGTVDETSDTRANITAVTAILGGRGYLGSGPKWDTQNPFNRT